MSRHVRNGYLVDAGDLTGDMLGVVAKTMQLASASVGSREADR